MPTYHKFEWEDFRIRAKPVGIRRLFGFLPYFTGSEPTFKITVDTISGELRQLNTNLEFYEPDNTRMDRPRLLSSQQTPVRHVSEMVKLHPIGVSGDHRFQIELAWKDKSSYRRDLITLTAISGDKTTMGIFAMLFTVIGGSIGALITHFIDC